MQTSLPDEREQQLVRRFFDDARSGFFVEVGANRPQQQSQTWHLEQLGWSGVLIEPQPNLADELSRLRRAKVFAVAWPVGGLVEPWDHAGRCRTAKPRQRVGGAKSAPVPSLREAWLRGSPQQLQPLHG